MKKYLLPVAAVAMAASSVQAMAVDFKVEITNLTNANYFTPLITAAHKRTLDMFEVGEPANAAIQAIAEGGDVSAMQAALEGGNASVDVSPGMVAPGETHEAIVSANRRNRKLSISAMILPTNDAFVGLDSMDLGGVFRKTVYLNGYDAGTEANDEIVNGGGAVGVPGIPGDPSQNAGTGATGAAGADANETVHIHRGIVGDDDAAGGISDLNRLVHRWLNPVAKVVITRVRRY